MFRAINNINFSFIIENPHPFLRINPIFHVNVYQIHCFRLFDSACIGVFYDVILRLSNQIEKRTKTDGG